MNSVPHAFKWALTFDTEKRGWEVCFPTWKKLFGSVDESQRGKCARSVIPFVFGAQIPLVGPKDQGCEGRRGLGSGASGCSMLALAVFRMTASETVSLRLHGIFIHPSPASKAYL